MSAHTINIIVLTDNRKVMGLPFVWRINIFYKVLDILWGTSLNKVLQVIQMQNEWNKETIS